MGWTALSCALIATFLTMLAGVPQEYIVPDPQPAALFNSGKAVKGEALLQLRDYVKQGDSLLHDLRKESFATLTELVKEGDDNVRDRLLGKLAQSKEQLKGRDDQLKEELDEDITWLKNRLTKGQRRLNEELAEEEAKRKEQLTEQKENLEKLRSSVKQWTQPCSAVTDDLKKQMTDVQVELKSTKQQLQTTQTELETSQRNLQSMQEIVRSNQAALNASQEKVSSIEEELQKTCDQLHHQEQAFTAVQTQLQDEVRSLKVEVDSLQSSYALLNSSEPGSTFTRGGNTTCPDNTSLVDSGKCPLGEGYAVRAGHCIKLYTTKADYRAANATCYNDGGHLYHFKSPDWDIPPIRELYPDDEIPWLWVGADELSTPSFTWSDGTPLYRNATVWAENEPNNAGTEECALLWKGYTLNDSLCVKELAFVCQIDL